MTTSVIAAPSKTSDPVRTVERPDGGRGADAREFLLDAVAGERRSVRQHLPASDEAGVGGGVLLGGFVSGGVVSGGFGFRRRVGRDVFTFFFCFFCRRRAGAAFVALGGRGIGGRFLRLGLHL